MLGSCCRRAGLAVALIFSAVIAIAGPAATARADIPTVHYRTVTVDGVELFYREAGPADAPAVLRAVGLHDQVAIPVGQGLEPLSHSFGQPRAAGVRIRRDLLREAGATGRVLVVDETRRTGGVSEGVLAALADHGFRGPVARVASEDSFVPLGDAAYVNAVMTATEAKTQALLDAGFRATGTASDAICVAAPAAGEDEWRIPLL